MMDKHPHMHATVVLKLCAAAAVSTEHHPPQGICLHITVVFIPVSAAIHISSHLTHLIEHIFVDENQPGNVLAHNVADCCLYTSYTYECQDIGQPQSSTVDYSTIPVSSLLPVEPNIG